MAHVLVVDEDASARKMIAEMVSIEGHTTSTAGDGLAGLAALRGAAHPLIVIMSYLMPGMTGAEAMEEIAADTQLATRHEYIFVSTIPYEWSFAGVSARLRRSVPFIAKPFPYERLINAVNAAAGRLSTRKTKQEPDTRQRKTKRRKKPKRGRRG